MIICLNMFLIYPCLGVWAINPTPTDVPLLYCIHIARVLCGNTLTFYGSI
jgi:hypothetical protein